jgi:hypothetical protein
MTELGEEWIERPSMMVGSAGFLRGAGSREKEGKSDETGGMNRKEA